MGTKMAPTYATLVMGYLEKNLYTKYEETFGKNEVEDFIKIFKTFLDDCFLLWKRSVEDLHKFHKTINNVHEKINFTMEKDESRIPFLDVLVYKEGRKLHTDITAILNTPNRTSPTPSQKGCAILYRNQRYETKDCANLKIS